MAHVGCLLPRKTKVCGAQKVPWAYLSGGAWDTLSRDCGSLAFLWTTEGPNPIHSESGNSTAQLPKNQNNRFSLHFFKLLGSWAVELPDPLWASFCYIVGSAEPICGYLLPGKQNRSPIHHNRVGGEGA